MVCIKLKSVHNYYRIIDFIEFIFSQILVLHFELDTCVRSRSATYLELQFKDS